MKRIQNTPATILLTEKQAQLMYNEGPNEGDPSWLRLGMEVIVTHKSHYFPIVIAKPSHNGNIRPEDKEGIFWLSQLEGDGL